MMLFVGDIMEKCTQNFRVNLFRTIQPACFLRGWYISHSSVVLALWISSHENIMKIGGDGRKNY